MIDTILGALQGNELGDEFRKLIGTCEPLRSIVVQQLCPILDGPWTMDDLKQMGRDIGVNLSTIDNIRDSGVSPEESVKILAEYFYLIMQEETIRYDVVPAIFLDVMTYIALDSWNAATGGRVVGKAKLRTKLLAYLANPAKAPLMVNESHYHTPSARATPMQLPLKFESEPEEKRLPATSTPHPLFAVPKLAGNVDMDLHGAAMRRAEQLLKTVMISKFDGMDGFVVWRYGIFELLTSYHSWSDWGGYY